METKNETTEPKLEPKPVYEQIILGTGFQIYIRITWDTGTEENSAEAI